MLRGRALVQNINRAALNFRSGFCKRHRYGLLQHFHGFGQPQAQCSGQSGLHAGSGQFGWRTLALWLHARERCLRCNNRVTVTLDFAESEESVFDLFGGGRSRFLTARRISVRDVPGLWRTPSIEPRRTGCSGVLESTVFFFGHHLYAYVYINSSAS